MANKTNKTNKTDKTNKTVADRSAGTYPRIVAIDAEGKAARVRAERLEIELGDGRKLLLAFPEKAWGDLEIEAEADDDSAVPMLSLQPGACNLMTLRVDVHHDLSFVEPLALPAGEHSPVLKLQVQKAVEGEDKANCPKKNHIRRWATAALRASAQVTVRLVGEVEGRALNRDYRGKDASTDVLSFTYGSDSGGEATPDEDPEGEIVIAVPTARRQAAAAGHSLAEEVSVLVIHGLHHILGMDHEEDEEAARMASAEAPYRRRIAARFRSRERRS